MCLRLSISTVQCFHIYLHLQPREGYYPWRQAEDGALLAGLVVVHLPRLANHFSTNPKRLDVTYGLFQRRDSIFVLPLVYFGVLG